MRGALAALIALGATSACGGGGGDDDVPAPWLEGYAFRKAIELHPPALAMGLVDFPVAIINKDDPDLAANAADDGSDIVVTDAGGNRLSFELEELESDGRLSLWVRIPALGSLTVYMYYGGDTASNVPDQTWSSRFAAVWHLADADLAIGRDSTSNRFHLGQGTADALPAGSKGLAGGARRFDGMDDFLVIDDAGATALDPGTGSFSYCLWAFPTAANGPDDCALCKGAASPADAGYNLKLGDGDWVVNLADDTIGPVGAAAAGFQPTLLSHWFHGCGVIDRSTQELHAYGNGAPRATVDLAGLGSIASPVSLQLGMNRATDPFVGQIDEVRIYTEALPLPWVVAEYVNLADPDAFLTIGPEEQRP